MSEEAPAHLPIPPGKTFFQHKKHYKGYPHKQADTACEVFRQFFSEQEFDRVIELGTGAGGFALFLAELLGPKYHTFDITDKVAKHKGLGDKIAETGATRYIENVFETDTVARLIAEGGRVMVMCDNGHKHRELEMFWPMISVGDVIMVHDYLKDYETYLAQNTWKTCAFIDEYVKTPLLQPYYQELWATAFWMCRTRVDNEEGA